MTVAFSEIQDNDRYIIKIGNGYFVRFNGNNPYMVNTPILASVFNYYEAVGIMVDLEKLHIPNTEMVLEPGR